MPNGCCDQHGNPRSLFSRSHFTLTLRNSKFLEWCRFWASIGECNTNSDWMVANCQLACNTCRTPSTTPVQSSTSVQEPAATSNAARPSTTGAGEQPTPSSKPRSGGGSCKQDSTAEQLITDGLINAIEETGSRNLISIDDVTRAVASGCVPQLGSSDCSQSLCYYIAYRSFDGLCNNLQDSLKGAAFRPYLR